MNALLNSRARDSFLVELTDEELFSERSEVGDFELDDARRFEELVRRYRPVFARFFGKRFDLSPDMLEEALQSTFVRLWSKRASYDPARPFRPWAYRVAASQVVDVLRANRDARRAFSLDAPCESEDGTFLGEAEFADQGASDPSSELERRELVVALRNALKRLPTRLQQAIELVFYQGMTFQGASKILNVTAATISQRVARGAKLLRFHMLEGSANAPKRCAAF